MSTLRNKTLVKDMEQAKLYLNMQNLQINTNGVVTGAIAAKKLVSVQHLQKITRAFLILKERNRRLVECVNALSTYYEHKYRSRFIKLRSLLSKKQRKIEHLKKINKQSDRHLMVVRHANSFFIYTDFKQISKPDAAGFSVVAYKLSPDPDVDKCVCISLAKNKFNNAAVVSSDGVLFANSKTADEFESNIKEMFKGEL
ncbi:hypothetical protein [Orgyia leucostigma nucleopolyhedrovirus]|uniref:Uncharacterized protein n=1 Tax=Orgyia leucostigma nucleopolyhedrovirus TaxID=490711 RepID=B0FDZ7_9ABAC|nr:hypothetical protein [Orgyia leucostigma nucleopolyhedrovirus]ABY65855.1 hypothetical protein [Orgyia leucostigma nucleopolyhedrovirus]